MKNSIKQSHEQEPISQRHYAHLKEMIKKKQLNYSPGRSSSSESDSSSSDSDVRNLKPQSQLQANAQPKNHTKESRRGNQEYGDGSNDYQNERNNSIESNGLNGVNATINQRETLKTADKNQANFEEFDDYSSPIKYDDQCFATSAENSKDTKQSPRNGHENQISEFELNNQNQAPSMRDIPQNQSVDQQLKSLDEQFVVYMLQIEERYQQCLNSNGKWLVEQWSKVLCQVVQSKNQQESLRIRRNRNLYTQMLLGGIINQQAIEGVFLERPCGQLHDLPLIDANQVNQSRGSINVVQPFGHNEELVNLKIPCSGQDGALNRSRSQRSVGAEKRKASAGEKKESKNPTMKSLDHQTHKVRNNSSQKPIHSQNNSQSGFLKPPKTQSESFEAQPQKQRDVQMIPTKEKSEKYDEIQKYKDIIEQKDLQIQNLEKFIDKKQKQTSESKNQIKLLQKMIEKNEQDEKLREELIIKQTDIVDNLARQMQKANAEISTLKQEARTASSQRDAALDQLRDAQIEQNKLEEAANTNRGASQAQEKRQMEKISDLENEIEKLRIEKDQLKHKNERYQELSEKLLEQLEERDKQEDAQEVKDKIRKEVAEEIEARFQEVMNEKKRLFDEELERLAQKHEVALKKRDQDISNERDNFVRAQRQIDELKKRLAEIESSRELIDQQFAQENDKGQNQNMLPELTKSELIIQKCEQYISKQKSHRGEIRTGMPIQIHNINCQENKYIEEDRIINQLNMPPNIKSFRQSDDHKENPVIQKNAIQKQDHGSMAAAVKSHNASQESKNSMNQKNQRCHKQCSRNAGLQSTGLQMHGSTTKTLQSQNSVTSSSQVLLGALNALGQHQQAHNGGANSVRGSITSHGASMIQDSNGASGVNYGGASMIMQGSSALVQGIGTSMTNLPVPIESGQNLMVQTSHQGGLPPKGGLRGSTTQALTQNYTKTLNETIQSSQAANYFVPNKSTNPQQIQSKPLQMHQRHQNQLINDHQHINLDQVGEIQQDSYQEANIPTYHSKNANPKNLQPQQLQLSQLFQANRDIHGDVQGKVPQGDYESTDHIDFAATELPTEIHDVKELHIISQQNASSSDQDPYAAYDQERISKKPSHPDQPQIQHHRGRHADQIYSQQVQPNGAMKSQTQLIEEQILQASQVQMGQETQKLRDGIKVQRNHQKQYSQFEQRQDFQTYRTLRDDQDEEGEPENNSQAEEEFQTTNQGSEELGATTDSYNQESSKQSDATRSHRQAGVHYIGDFTKHERKPSAEPNEQNQPQVFSLNLGKLDNNVNNITRKPSRKEIYVSDPYGPNPYDEQYSCQEATNTRHDSTGVRSNDRYDKYCDELCDELLDEEEGEDGAAGTTTEREDRIGDETQDLEDADQTEMELQAQLYQIQQRHEINQNESKPKKNLPIPPAPKQPAHHPRKQSYNHESQIQSTDRGCDSSLTHQSDAPQETSRQTSSRQVVGPKTKRGQETTASRHLKIIQDRYTQQQIQFEEQFSEMIDENDEAYYEEEPDEQESPPNHQENIEHLKHHEEEQSEPESSENEEDEDLFKLSQFLTKRNQNSIDKRSSHKHQNTSQNQNDKMTDGDEDIQDNLDRNYRKKKDRIDSMASSQLRASGREEGVDETFDQFVDDLL